MIVRKYSEKIQKKYVKGGFTLVELSLSLVFISVLSIAVTLIVTNSIAAYHRGLVLNQLNTIGMELVNDMQAAVQNAPAISVKGMCSTMYSGQDEIDCEKEDGRRFVSVSGRGNVTVGGNTIEVPLYGAFCTGSYSYIWNSGYFFDDNQYNVGMASPAQLVYTGVNANNEFGTWTIGGLNGDFRLLKVKDRKRSVCVAANETNVFNIAKAENNDYGEIDEVPIDVMAEDGGLALYDLDAGAPVSDGAVNNMFYAVSFILGTIQGGINVTSGNYCVTPEDATQTDIEAFDYCAINKFNFAAQSNGKGGE